MLQGERMAWGDFKVKVEGAGLAGFPITRVIDMEVATRLMGWRADWRFSAGGIPPGGKSVEKVPYLSADFSLASKLAQWWASENWSFAYWWATYPYATKSPPLLRRQEEALAICEALLNSLGPVFA